MQTSQEFIYQNERRFFIYIVVFLTEHIFSQWTPNFSDNQFINQDKRRIYEESLLLRLQTHICVLPAYQDLKPITLSRGIFDKQDFYWQQVKQKKPFLNLQHQPLAFNIKYVLRNLSPQLKKRAS